MTAHTDPLLRQIHRLVSPPDRLPDSDAVLLHRFLTNKDEDAFAALVARHGPMVMGVCRRVLGNVHEAEDAAQASFVVLARQAATLRRPEALAAWLHRTARHLALAARRADSRRRQRETRCYAPREPTDPLEEISLREALLILDEEVQRLPERYRLPVILCCLQARTVEEAARQLSWSVGSLRGRLLRGRARLQARLIRRGVTLAAAPVVLGGLAAMSTAAAVPAGFTTSILRAIPRCAQGTAAPTVLTLVEEGMKSTVAARMRGLLALVMLVGVTAAGVGSLAYRGKPHAQPAAQAAQPSKARASKPQARTDAFGDPLPEGAVARLGTLRWRHNGMTTHVQFAPDGKSLLTMGDDGLRIWDTDSGRCRHHLPNQEGRYLGPGILSADGKRVVSVDLNRKEKRLGLWDVASGRLLREFGDHTCIAGSFSPDRKVLATVGTSQPGDPRFRDFADVISLWDLTTGERIHSWKSQHAGVYCVAFTADGKTLITGGADRALRFWDAASGRLLRRLTGSSRPIGHIVLSADGKHLAAIGLKADPAGVLFPSALSWYADNYLGLWDMAEGKEVRRFSLARPKDRRNPGLVMAAFPPDGKTLLAVGLDSFACCWDLTTGKESRRLDVGGIVRAAAVAPDGKTLAVVTLSSVRLFDLPGGKERTPTAGHCDPVFLTLITPDGQTTITGGAGYSGILVWDTATGRERYRLPEKGRLATDLRLAPDGRTLYALDSEGDGWSGTLVWDLPTRKRIRRLPLPPVAKLSSLLWALSPDGKTQALAERFGQVVYLLDSADGKEKRRIQVPETGVSYLAFGPDSRSLVVVCYDGTVRTWDPANGSKLAQLPARGYTMRRGQGFGPSGRDTVALSPDGRWLARVTREGSPVVMERATGNLAPLPKGTDRGVSLFAFSPDSRTLAWCGWRDSTIHLLEVASGQERRTLAGHGGAVESLAFSRDGRLLISGSHDSTALVWGLFDRPGAALADAELNRCWEDLASEQADRAYQAMQQLVRNPDQAVTELGKHLRPVVSADAAEVRRLLTDLESDEFRVRQKASAALQKLGERAEPGLREALEGEQPLEARKRVEALLESLKVSATRPEALRSLRAVEVLEQIGSPAARRVLSSLAEGLSTARLTREARASLARLAERPGTKP